MRQHLPPHPIHRATGVLLALVMAAAAALVAIPSAAAQGPATFVFTGGGWGHGVGMSQNGARNMADQGRDHVAILAHYYPNTVILPTTPLGDIRVHIGDASRVELESGGAITFERNGAVVTSIGTGSIQISAHDGGLQIGGTWSPTSPTEPVMVSFPQPVKVTNNGHRYLWGKFQLTNRNGKVRVVEVLPLERYVAGISEMPSAWPIEALMAQAIAARTYAHEVTLHRRGSSEWAQEYDISATTVDQNYIGWDAQDGAWDQQWLAAVKATAGVEIVDNSGPVRAYYSASNGGWMESANYVFGNDVTHTVAAADPFDAGGHDWSSWTRTYTQSAMSRWLNASSDTAVGTLSAINVLGGHGASARIDKATVELVGTGGTKRVTGKRLMLVMNAGIFGEGGGLSDHLPSTFTTIGNGQSAGMPQPSGQASAPEATPDPTPNDVPADGGYTPPPGWTPEPGTGVDPIPVQDDSAEPANTADATGEGDSSTTFTPEPGWTPEPGTGVDPLRLSPGSASGAADSTGGYTPPPGWTPEPGTGVDPVPIASPTATPEPTPSSSRQGYAPPPGWTPEPGTGVDPVPVATTEPTPTPAPTQTPEPTATGDTSTIGGTGGGYAPPPGWAPDPGTGIDPVPVAASSAASTSVGSSSDHDELVVDEFDVDRAVMLLARTSDGAAELRACTPADYGFVCVSLETLRSLNE